MIWMKAVKLICVVCLSFLVLGCATKPKCDVNVCPVGCALSTDTCGPGDRCCSLHAGAPCSKCAP